MIFLNDSSADPGKLLVEAPDGALQRLIDFDVGLLLIKFNLAIYRGENNSVTYRARNLTPKFCVYLNENTFPDIASFCLCFVETDGRILNCNGIEIANDRADIIQRNFIEPNQNLMAWEPEELPRVEEQLRERIPITLLDYPIAGAADTTAQTYTGNYLSPETLSFYTHTLSYSIHEEMSDVTD